MKRTSLVETRALVAKALGKLKVREESLLGSDNPCVLEVLNITKDYIGALQLVQEALYGNKTPLETLAD